MKPSWPACGRARPSAARRVHEAGAPFAPAGAHEHAATVEPLESGDGHPTPQLAPGQHGLGCERERRRERADDPLVRHLERAERTAAQVRLAPVELLDRELANQPRSRSRVTASTMLGSEPSCSSVQATAAPPSTRPGCRRSPRSGRAARTRTTSSASSVRAWRRSPCAAARCSPCSCRRRRRAPPRAASRAGRRATAHARSRSRRLRRRLSAHRSRTRAPRAGASVRPSRPLARASRRSTRPCRWRRTRPPPRAPRRATRPGRARASCVMS